MGKQEFVNPKYADNARLLHQPTFVDVFAGCGGLSLGLMNAGWKGLFAIEHNADAFSTLNHNLIDSTNKLNFDWPSWLPKSPHDTTTFLKNYKTALTSLSGGVDMMVGGPPCQGFSTAGRRDPNDPRNQLTKSYLKLVKHIRPKIVLIENVRGITANFGDEEAPGGKLNYSKWIIKSLSKDYIVESQLLDTSLFGVPQKRKRFFIMGYRKDLPNAKTFSPFELIENDRLDFLSAKSIKVPVSSKQALSDLEIAKKGIIKSPDSAGYNAIKHSQPTTVYQKMMKAGHKGHVPDTRLARHKEHITKRFSEIIKICHVEGRLNKTISQELKDKYGLKKRVIRVLDPASPAPTITSMPDDLIHYSEPRALTVRENARLQSFPDWFAFKGRYTTGGQRRKIDVPRFTQVANAVPPLAAEAIGVTLKKYVNSFTIHASTCASEAKPQNAHGNQLRTHEAHASFQQ